MTSTELQNHSASQGQPTSATYPQAIGPYSVARQAGNLVFVSGQLPIEPATGALVEGCMTQLTEQCMRNISAILADFGLTLHDIVKTTIFLVDINDFAEVNTAYAQALEGMAVYPARSTIAVAQLPKNSRIEIEVIAQVRA